MPSQPGSADLSSINDFSLTPPPFEKPFTQLTAFPTAAIGDQIESEHPPTLGRLVYIFINALLNGRAASAASRRNINTRTNDHEKWTKAHGPNPMSCCGRFGRSVLKSSSRVTSPANSERGSSISEDQMCAVIGLPNRGTLNYDLTLNQLASAGI